jgi:hypothetical protein
MDFKVHSQALLSRLYRPFGQRHFVRIGGQPYPQKSVVATLKSWLVSVRNINAVNDAIQSAKPWYAKMGMAVRT